MKTKISPATVGMFILGALSLFVVLFLSMSITDRGEYQKNIDLYQNTTAATK